MGAAEVSSYFRRKIPLVEQVSYTVFREITESGISVEDFCARIGCSRRKMRELMFGRRKYRLEDLSNFLFAFGKELDWRVTPR